MPHSSHFPEHPAEMTLFERDITPLPHPSKPGVYLQRFNPRWRNGNGNPLGGLYLPIAMSAASQDMKRLGQNYDTPVTNYTQFVKSASLDATVQISVTSMKKGRTMNFLLVNIHEIGKDGQLALCTTSHLVYAAGNQLPDAYPIPRTVTPLHPLKPPTLPGHKDCVDFFEAFGLTTGRPADRGFSFLCDKNLAKDLRHKATNLRHALSSGKALPSDAQKALDMSIECHVGFIDPESHQVRRHDWLTVGLMTDCLWAINELYAAETQPGWRFWSTTVSLAIHFFPPLPTPGDIDGYLLARASITHIQGGLSELEALIWDARGERLIATGRQTCLTNRVLVEKSRV